MLLLISVGVPVANGCDSSAGMDGLTLRMCSVLYVAVKCGCRVAYVNTDGLCETDDPAAGIVVDVDELRGNGGVT